MYRSSLDNAGDVALSRVRIEYRERKLLEQAAKAALTDTDADVPLNEPTITRRDATATMAKLADIAAKKAA